ncbi:MAG: hypothetical protein M1817_004839 [Caeruleum heppii]|nr:MAG: hypothetical protein M1817_004839 [Caeruleum heppii]
MGGILSAEVVLLAPPTYPAAERFRHRILGIINFDTPFIGMHPGVIVSGLSSLFRPGSDSPKPTPHVDTQSPYPAFAGNQASADSPSYQTGQDCMTSTATSPEYAESSTALSTMSTAHSNSTTDTLSPFASPTQIDPNYNPPFPNDIRVPKRAGLNNAVHFVTKHSDGLTKATRQYVTSHLEFTGCLADYPGLRRRYGAIRALEDIDDIHFRPSVNLSMQPRRVRFVNYYTASTGRVRKSKLPSSRSDGIGPASPADLSIVSSRQSIRSASRSPRISVEEHRDDVVVPRPLDEPDEAPDDLRGVENTLEDGLFDIEELKKSTTQGSRSPPTGAGVSPTAKRESSDLPEIPSLPREPHFFDPSQYTDRETLRRAEKEHGRLLKTYKQAVKDRDRVLRDREKTIARQSKRARQDWARGVKAAAKKLEVEAKQRLRAERQALNQPYVLNPEALNDTGFSPDGDVGGPTTRTKKDKKFCMLPPKINGRVDPTWIRVYMEGVDEVGAHCGLFFLGEAYEKLVGDVAMRMEEWVRDDETRRLVRKMEGLEM